MVLAALDSFGFRAFLLLHILAIVVAFAPGFVWPLVGLALRKEQRTVGALYTVVADNALKIQGVAMILAGLFGFAMIGMSDKAYKFSQSWVSIALLLWFLGIGVIYGLLLPTLKRAGSGNETSEAADPDVLRDAPPAAAPRRHRHDLEARLPLTHRRRRAVRCRRCTRSSASATSPGPLAPSRSR